MSTEPVQQPLAASTDRRGRARERRRNQVYDVAIALFTDKGFDNTTMEEIADRADVARATVFNHFPRKTSFLDEWSARRRRLARDAVAPDHLSNRPLREILERYMTTLATVSVRARKETVALMRPSMHTTDVLGHPLLGAELTAIMRRAQARGQLGADVDTATAGLVLAAGYFATIMAWIDSDPDAFRLDARLIGVVEIVLDGVFDSDATGARTGAHAKRAG